MERWSLKHLAKASLLEGLHSVTQQDCVTTAEMLAYIGEVEARELYLELGHPSMYQYCVRVLGMCEQIAYKRIRVARRAREYPTILDRIADSRLNLSKVLVLSRFLGPVTAEELLEAAAGSSRAELEVLLAERYPGRCSRDSIERAELSPGTVDRLTPVAAGSWQLRSQVNQRTRELLQEALELMSHRNPSGRHDPVLEPALELLVAKLRKEKYAETGAPREGSDSSGPRCIPAVVRRAVDQRDQDACTFVGDDGHVCGSRWQVEYDHIVPVARGGKSTVDNVRLLCRAHNQYAAKQTYGAGFMEEKKRLAMEARAAERAKIEEESKRRAEERWKDEAEAKVQAEAAAGMKALVNEVIPYLRKLRFTAEESRQRAEGACAFLPEGSLHDRVKSALSGSYARAPQPVIAPAAPGVAA